jgi:hypothetical protein
MSTITVRALDANGDPLQGNGQLNFISDLAAITQIIRTRLLLFQGEWFLNLLDGLPLSQSILGASGSQRSLQIIINIISARITGTPYVTSISYISASYLNRAFTYSAKVETQFGTVYVTNTPGLSASLN